MRVALRVVLIVFVIFALITGGMVLWFYSGIGLPKLSSLGTYQAAQNSKIFSADGTLLTEVHGDENREWVSIEEIPEYMQQAAISIEDKDFYRHSGIDWKAVVRAFWANVVQGAVVEGGSTITQQYVKNAYVGAERTLWRKVEEANLAYQLEKKFTKQEILEKYLNDIYLGNGCYGIFIAARTYFNKKPAELTLGECALLAGLIRSPSYYSPYENLELALKRRDLVLDRMFKQGYISRTEADATKQDALQIVPQDQDYSPPPAPYFCDYIKERVKDTMGDQAAYRGGLRIYTTLDMHLQHLAEKVIVQALGGKKDAPDAALVAIDPKTGYIKAMVGGKDFLTNQYNLAAQGHRQPGSAFKVFVLARAMADGVSPNRTYDSSSPQKIKIPGGGTWVVRNYSGSGGGHISITQATVRSVNCVYAQLIMDLGPARVSRMAKQMGIMTDVGTNPAISIGGLEIGVSPLEMASAFGTLANNGHHAVPRTISKITDSEGKVLEEYSPETNKVLDPKVVAKVNSILTQVVKGGTGSGANIGRPQAGKTGTTDDHADAWFVGYTPDLVTAVWVGYPQGRISLRGMSGGGLPATLWRRFMKEALKNTPPTAFPEAPSLSDTYEFEDDMISVKICSESGLLAGPYCSNPVSREYRRGTEPSSFCSVHQGTNQKSVPSVVGMTESSARSLLANAGFAVSTQTGYSDRVFKGQIMSQSPAGGSVAAEGSTVTIVVSQGSSGQPVPNLIGLGESAAKSSIRSAGLRPLVTYAPSDQVGIVLGQSPGAGTNLPSGSTVAITVGKSYER